MRPGGAVRGPGPPASVGFVLVLLLAAAEFGQVWYYPPPQPGLELARAFGGSFRMALWLAATGCILLHLLRRGPWRVLGAFAPYLPALAWGAAVVAVWSIDRIGGARVLAFWTLAGGVAVAAGTEVSPATLARAVALLFLGVVAASLAAALLAPDAALMRYGTSETVRGLFPHKNAFGWFCALGLVWAAGTRRLLPPGLALVVAATMAAGLAASGSKTAIAMLPCAAGYALAFSACRRVLPDPARGALALAVIAALAAVLASLLAPAVIDWLGREENLTGRTEVWRHYLAYLHDRPLTGYGTGILSTDTQLNRAIGAAVPGQESQRLRSPHSLYLGVASETGIIGLALFVGAQAWVALVAPFRRAGPWAQIAGTLAVAILLAGITEMRDGFLPGTATVLLLAARAAALRGG